MGKGFKPLSWLVTYHDVNTDKIKYYDILKYRQDFIKKLKKKCATKEEFAEKMRNEMMWSFWSQCEWEMIIEFDEDGRVWLSPWVGSREPEKVRIDVTDRTDFDWCNFAEDHILNKGYRDGTAKIDVYDQLEYRWDEFIDYCWYNRLRYERDNPKFHRTCKDCAHFIGAGDWNLCCTESHEGYPFGFLCYEDTPACEKFAKKTDNDWR